MLFVNADPSPGTHLLPMTRKQRRATLILSSLAVLFLAVGLIVYAGTQNGASLAITCTM